MNDALSLSITVVCIVAALTVGVQAAGHRYRWTRVAPTLVLLEVAVLAQALLDVIGLAGGHRPRETVPHVAYLAASVLVVPMVAAQTRRDDDRWSAGLVVAGLVVLAVLVVRLQTTWRGAGG